MTEVPVTIRSMETSTRAALSPPTVGLFNHVQLVNTLTKHIRLTHSTPSLAPPRLTLKVTLKVDLSYNDAASMTVFTFIITDAASSLDAQVPIWAHLDMMVWV